MIDNADRHLKRLEEEWCSAMSACAFALAEGNTRAAKTWASEARHLEKEIHILRELIAERSVA